MIPTWRIWVPSITPSFTLCYSQPNHELNPPMAWLSIPGDETAAAMHRTCRRDGAARVRNAGPEHKPRVMTHGNQCHSFVRLSSSPPRHIARTSFIVSVAWFAPKERRSAGFCRRDPGCIGSKSQSRPTHHLRACRRSGAYFPRPAVRSRAAAPTIMHAALEESTTQLRA